MNNNLVWTFDNDNELEPWSLPLKLNSPYVNFETTVYGGPYFSKPVDMFGVKLAQELDLKCDVDLPIKDFSIPNIIECKEALKKTVEAIFQDKKVYAGCFGGKGRTGLFLALLTKSFGIEFPVQHVRRHYHSHAVETMDQYEFVRDFDVKEINDLVIDLASKKLQNKNLESIDNSVKENKRRQNF